MSTYIEIREKLASAARSAVDTNLINVYSTTRKGPSPPAIVLRAGKPAVVPHQTFSSRGAIYNFTVHFVTGQISDKSAQDAVAELIDLEGVFVQALEAAFCDGQWAKAEQIATQETPIGTTAFAGALFNVQIVA